MKIFQTLINLINATAIVAFLFPLNSFSQEWERYEIDISECSVVLPSEPEWYYEYSQDSSFVWSGEVQQGNMFFGVICIEFAVPFDTEEFDEYDLILIAEDYLDYLKDQFSITSFTGYEHVSWIDSETGGTGISDYWTDAEGDPWAVQCWIDPYNLAVLYIYSDPETDFSDYEEHFFNSFWFPEE
ncbi:MAG TPA: hypothetical protein PLW31_13065 [Bacteroidales bacterium]|nr:hypothetical protein [Bacteroidales bacterium]HPM93533.1 hypothetical protein [Bacteroidales bacterium]